MPSLSLRSRLVSSQQADVVDTPKMGAKAQARANASLITPRGDGKSFGIAVATLRSLSCSRAILFYNSIQAVSPVASPKKAAGGASKLPASPPLARHSGYALDSKVASPEPKSSRKTNKTVTFASSTTPKAPTKTASSEVASKPSARAATLVQASSPDKRKATTSVSVNAKPAEGSATDKTSVPSSPEPEYPSSDSDDSFLGSPSPTAGAAKAPSSPNGLTPEALNFSFEDVKQPPAAAMASKEDAAVAASSLEGKSSSNGAPGDACNGAEGMLSDSVASAVSNEVLFECRSSKQPWVNGRWDTHSKLTGTVKIERNMQSLRVQFVFRDDLGAVRLNLGITQGVTFRTQRMPKNTGIVVGNNIETCMVKANHSNADMLLELLVDAGAKDMTAAAH
jgi:hypothetical protein